MTTMDCKMDFYDIMASTIHDTKNSLGMLLGSLEDIMATLEDDQASTRLSQLQYEIKYLNHGLIRLLALYKAEKSQLAPSMDWYSVSEFIEEISLHYEQLSLSRGITIEEEVPDGLFWAFDSGLIAGVIDNAMNNAFRHTEDKIKLSASDEGGYLVIAVADNGGGYPDSMLRYGKNHPEYKQQVDFNLGNTGLGLYFSSLVAALHTREGREGYVSLVNGGAYGGGLFSLHLP